MISHGKHRKHGRMHGKPDAIQKIICALSGSFLNSLMIQEELTFKIRGAIYEVFKELGPGLFESVYERALIKELRSKGMKVLTQVPVDVFYKGEDLQLGFRLDLLVDDEVIIEVKSVEQLHDVHKKQLLNYLKLTGKRVGLLVNFNSAYIKDNFSLVRIVN